jgi:MFS superfamily sulfate permease-like transporter
VANRVVAPILKLNFGLANLIVGLLGGYDSSALVGQSKFNFKMGATTRLN